MTRNELRDLLRSMKDYPNLEVTEATRLIDDLGFTSLDVMNLILALEKQFHITFQDQHLELDCFATVGAVLDTVQSYDVAAL
jgi:acyl carrier protein